MKIILGFVLALMASSLVNTSTFSAEVLHAEMELFHASTLRIPALPGEYNGIKINKWAKTNSDYNKAKGSRIAGKVVGFEYKGEAYPIAVFKGGKMVSVFWLEKMKTQRD